MKAGLVMKFTLFLYPEGKERMLALYELAQSPAWPAMRMAEGEMAMLPKPTTPWGCPVLPLMMAGTPFAQLPVIPETEEIRRCVAAIMRKATLPETGRTGAALTTKWRRLANNPEELTSKTVAVTWPAASATPAVNGKSNFLKQLTK